MSFYSKFKKIIIITIPINAQLKINYRIFLSVILTIIVMLTFNDAVF